MSNSITVTYGGVVVLYLEPENRWRFELRGRERSTDSLRKAKEAIDAPEPKDKKPFNRIAAYFFSYGCPVTGTVTSIAERTYRSTEAWFIKDSDKNRSKEYVTKLYPITPENTKLIDEWKATKVTIDRLQGHQTALVKKMSTVAIVIGVKDDE